ncbi:MAG: elongation factor P [bacterium]|nr:elongation factor P [bacterium]
MANTIQASSIRRGTIIMYNNDPHRVLEFQHRTPGNLRAFVQVKLRNLRNGISTEARFSATEWIERADLETHPMEFLYSDNQGYHFMNTETYEQVALDSEILGDAIYYLTPNLKVMIDFLDGNPIAVELPPAVELKVIETEPELKTATITNVTKPAKLETGLVIQVPPFINVGDIIKVKPDENKYLERVNR